MKTLILILLSTFAFGQKAKLQPQIGIHWTGGLSYDMEQELPSAQLGIVYTPKNADLIMSNIGVNANFYYDVVSERPNNMHSYYVLRLQFAKEVFNHWNVTYYGGYINNFHNNLMKHYDGNFKSNLAYGIGFQVTDDNMTAEFIYESLGGYPNFSVGVNFNIIDLLKNK